MIFHFKSGVGMDHKMYIIDCGLIGLLLLAIAILLALSIGHNAGYERGQVDALNGKFKYKLVQEKISYPVHIICNQ